MKTLEYFIAIVIIQTVIFIIAIALTHLFSTEIINFYWICGVVAGIFTEKIFRLIDNKWIM